MKSYLGERHVLFSHIYPWNFTPTLVNTARKAILAPVHNDDVGSDAIAI